MEREAETNSGFWHRLDGAVFGLVYGTITALSVLMAMGAHPDEPFRMAAALFGSVLAVTLAKAFAEVMADEVSPARVGARIGLREAWHHSRPTLIAANVPTLLILASGFGVMSTEHAILLAQGFGIAMLLALGGRVGWVARGSWHAIAVSALFTGGIGVALAVFKYILH